MADYGAWAGLGNAIGNVGESYLAAKKARLDAALKNAEIGEKKSMADFYSNKNNYLYGGPTPDNSAPSPSTPTPAGIPVLPPGSVNPATGEVMGGPPSAPAAAAPAPGAGLTRKSQEQLTLQQDREKAAADRAAKSAAAKANAPGLSRGEAALIGKYFTPSDSARLSSVPNATNLHNALVDLHQAYSDATAGDPSRAMAMLKQKAANNDWLRTQIGSVGNNPENIIPVYNAARRAAGIELFKISNGSSAMPNEAAIADNEKQYPDLKMPLPQAQSLFNLTKDTQILPAIQGLRSKIQLNQDPQTGKYSVKELEKLSRSLDAWESKVSGSVHNLKGGVADKIIPNEAGPVPGAPAVGTIEDGHRFKGGNPGDPANWEPVQ